MGKRVIFQLSMPSNNSWNGKWSGEKNVYTVVRSVPEKIFCGLKRHHTYSFGDGWVAAVTNREALPREKATNRFNGYEWMIDSILNRDAITVNDN